MDNVENLIDSIEQFIQDIYTELDMTPSNIDVSESESESQLSNCIESSSLTSDNNLSGDTNADMISEHAANESTNPSARSVRNESPTRILRSSARVSPRTPPTRSRSSLARRSRTQTNLSPNVIIDLSEIPSPPRRSSPQPPHRSSNRQSPLHDNSCQLNNSDVILVEPNEVIDLCTPKAEASHRRHYVQVECPGRSMLRSRRNISMAPNNMAPPNDTTSHKKCPICLEAIQQPTATICGHIYCLKCIKQAVTVNPKCPLCKTKTDKKGLRRIYL